MTEPDNPYAAPEAPAPALMDRSAPNDRSMFTQILAVGILQTIVGGLELLIGGAFGVISVLVPWSLRNGSMQEPNEAMTLWTVALVYGGIGGGAIISGCLRLTSGIGSFYFRFRPLMMVSLIFGLISTFTCYCALTAAPLAIYGMIVMCSPTAKRAFAMRKAGLSPTEIRRIFNS